MVYGGKSSHVQNYSPSTYRVGLFTALYIPTRSIYTFIVKTFLAIVKVYLDRTLYIAERIQKLDVVVLYIYVHMWGWVAGCIAYRNRLPKPEKIIPNPDFTLPERHTHTYATRLRSMPV